MQITRRNFIIGGTASLGALATAPVLSSCSKNAKTKSGLKISDFESPGTASFNTGLQDTYTSNVPTTLCIITNDNGLEACITNLGARLVSLLVPDQEGKLQDVVLGFDNIADYANIEKFDNVFGAEVGRTINRIDGGAFTYDGVEYQLDKNFNNKHNLHGGRFGWHYQTWTVKESTSNSVTFKLVSPDGDSGFPGEVQVETTYKLDNNNSLWIDVKAHSNKATPINVANHTYFNLEGDPNKTCYNHLLQIYAKRYIPVAEDDIPTGELSDIEKGSDLDFYSQPKTMLKNVDLSRYTFKNTKGYDFSFFLDANRSVNATAYCPNSGIKMEVMTDRPIVHLYDAHDLDGTVVGKNNIAYKSMCAFCYETQNVPDGVNQDLFLNTILKPGQLFTSSVQYKFSTQ